jgi:hypothetical protein
MKPLKALAMDLAKRDTHIEYSLPITKCLLDHMSTEDWEDFESLVEAQDSRDFFAADFHVLVSWIHEGPSGLPLREPTSALGPKARLKEAKMIAKQLRHLSVKIQANFPELDEEYSLLKILFPWKHAEEPFTIGGASTDSESGMKGGQSCPERPFSAQERLYELTGSWSHVQDVVRRRKAYGLEVPVVGREYSVLSELTDYILQSAEQAANESGAKRKYPAWCMVAAHDLWRTINRSQLLRHASTAMKMRIMEYTIHAYAGYHGLEPPGAGWGPEQLRQVVYR